MNWDIFVYVITRIEGFKYRFQVCFVVAVYREVIILWL